MKLLSMWQPWASAVAWLLKGNETRSRRTHYRGPIAFHAAQQNGTAYLDLRRHYWRILEGCGMGHLIEATKGREMPRGAIVATGEILDCIPTEEIEKTHPLTPLERAFGDYGPGRFVWILGSVKPIVPMPYKGSQAMLTLPDQVVSQIEYLRVA